MDFEYNNFKLNTMYYFTLTETDAETNNAGTIAADNQKDLEGKIKIACQQHFDNEVRMLVCPPLEGMIYGRSSDVMVEFEDSDYPNVTLEICQTWLY